MTVVNAFEVSPGKQLEVPADVAPLFQPMQLGRFSLTNRVAYAPLTRCRTPTGTPEQITATYYGQRTTKGSLLISEATVIEPRGAGYPNTPGIFTDEHIKGWQQVTKEVRDKGGIFFCQLWHVGRVSHPDYQPNGDLPVSSSDLSITSPEYQLFSLKDMTMKAYIAPRALETKEVKEVVQMYRKAARNAITAGFDGIEVHGANGYLIDQFLKSDINKRTDEYGGSIENRARFAIEVMQAVVDEVGADRVGIRITPFTTFVDCTGSDPYAQHVYLVEQLSKMKLAYVHMVEPRVVGTGDGQENPSQSLKPFRQAYQGTFITAGGFDRTTGADVVRRGEADMVAYGRTFLANPDFHKRLLLNAPMTKYDRDTFYSAGAQGYTDYPFLEDK